MQLDSIECETIDAIMRTSADLLRPMSAPTLYVLSSICFQLPTSKKRKKRDYVGNRTVLTYTNALLMTSETPNLR